MSDSQSLGRRDFVKQIGATGVAVAGAGLVAAGAASTLAPKDYCKRIGETFVIKDESGNRFSGQLVEAEASKYSARSACRQQFSLVFKLPKGVSLDQDLYSVSGGGIRSQQMLLVPINTQHETMQAIVS